MKKKPAITKKEALAKKAHSKEDPLYMEIAQLDQAVKAFSSMMQARLHQKAILGWRGWNDSNKGVSSELLLKSITWDSKNHPTNEIKTIDIANKAMMLWYRMVMGV
jgi:hypothetical protein